MEWDSLTRPLEVDPVRDDNRLGNTESEGERECDLRFRHIKVPTVRLEGNASRLRLNRCQTRDQRTHRFDRHDHRQQ